MYPSTIDGIFVSVDGKPLYSLRSEISTQTETATNALLLLSISHIFRSHPLLTYNFASPNRATVHLPYANAPLSAPRCPVPASLSSVPGYHIST